MLSDTLRGNQFNLSSFDTGDSQQADQYECSICGRSFDLANGRGVHMGHNHTKYEIKTELIAGLRPRASRQPAAEAYAVGDANTVHLNLPPPLSLCFQLVANPVTERLECEPLGQVADCVEVFRYPI
jgi:hypothetical protein